MSKLLVSTRSLLRSYLTDLPAGPPFVVVRPKAPPISLPMHLPTLRLFILTIGTLHPVARTTTMMTMTPRRYFPCQHTMIHQVPTRLRLTTMMDDSISTTFPFLEILRLRWGQPFRSMRCHGSRGRSTMDITTTRSRAPNPVARGRQVDTLQGR